MTIVSVGKASVSAACDAAAIIKTHAAVAVNFNISDSFARSVLVTLAANMKQRGKERV
jgi:hypothetical protein